jgi:predicted NAD/FAD-dependent oxidoreductase
MHPDHIVVIGAGAAGLVAARELGLAGRKVTWFWLPCDRGVEHHAAANGVPRVKSRQRIASSV